MKTNFLKIAGTVLFACLLLSVAPSLPKNTRFARLAPESLSLRNNFYFGRGQWLADARTAAAAARYLYESRSWTPAPVGSAASLFFPTVGFEQSTNLPGLDETGTATLSHERRLSRADSLIVRARLMSSSGLTASEFFVSNGVTRIHKGWVPNNAQAPDKSASMSGPFLAPFPITGA